MIDDGPREMTGKYIVGTVDEIPPQARKIVDIEGRSVGVFNVDGAYYALRNRCPHQGAPLCEGQIVGTVRSTGPGSFTYDATRTYLQCPWHNWEFDLASGRSWFDPKRLRVRQYQVSVEDGAALRGDTTDQGGEVRCAGPYVVESFPVSIEENYVVIHVR